MGTLYSCRPKTLDIDVDEPAAKTVLNCILMADEPSMAFINISAAALKPDTLSNLNSAEVQIFENDKLLQAYKQDKSGNVYLDGFIPKGGSTYTIKAIASDKPMATAETKVPFPVLFTIDEPVKIKPIQAQEASERFAELKIKVTDSLSTDDYYVVRVKRFMISGVQSDTISADDLNNDPQQYLVMLLNSPSVDISAQDGIFSLPLRENIGSIYQGGYGDYMLLSDKLFNGKKQQLIMNINLTPYYELFSAFEMGLTVEVTRVNYEYYKYICTYERHRSTQADYFSEKVQVYNNVENGFVVFAAGAITKQSTNFKR